MLQAVMIADCFYVPGNHESYLEPEVYRQLVEGMLSFGVTVMEDSETILHKDGKYISIVGYGWDQQAERAHLNSFSGYRILLAHRPEYFADYVAADFDLVLSGHTHGGQVRLPWIGALFATGQGLFPEYDAGMYTQGDTDMFVSRGVGTTGLPFRFCNQPEIVVVELKCA